MRVMESVVFVFVLSCVVLTMPLYGVGITPSNVVWPSLPGETFGFDFVISDPMGVEAISYKSTIDVNGPGLLTFDSAQSEAVASDSNYWIYGNSLGAFAEDKGGNIYVFSDNPDNPPFETLLAGEIVARYAFTWDGTIGDYTFTLDLDTSKSRITDSSIITHPLQFNPGQYPGDDSSFTLHIVPEPTTLMLLGLGGLVLLRKRRGINIAANKFGGQQPIK